jgi:NAD(P)-dependent dehydrogenase (short-subunit alcohol dehydrogenase family)
LGEIEGRPKGESIKKYVNDLTALKRTSIPEDVARVVSFLSGPDSDFMTRQTVIVDGGICYS